MKRFLTIVAFFIATLTYAQLKDLKIDGTGSLHLYYTFNTMKNGNFAYVPQRVEKYQTFGIEGNINFFEKGQDRWNISIKALDDIVWDAAKGISDKVQAKHPRQAYYYSLTGLFWWRHAWNLIGNEGKFNCALGYSLSDYMVILPGVADHGLYNGQPYDIEPNGWYWAAGSTLMADYAIHKNFSLHLQTNFDIGFLTLSDGKKTHNIDGYPKPFFYRNSLTLMTGWGLFSKFDLACSLDRGELNQNITRMELQIGFAAPIK